MKKLLFITAAFVGMLFVTSCSNNDDPTPPTPDSDLYLKILKQDVNTCLEKYPAYKKESQFDYQYGYFVEAKYTLNGKVSDLPASELKAIKVEYGFAYTTGAQATEIVHILNATRIFENGPEADMTYQEVERQGYPADLDIIEDLDLISLEFAISQLKKSNVTQPQTKIVRLRRPVLPDSDFKTMYRFDVEKGANTVVYVDAKTGAVETGNLPWPTDLIEAE